MPLPTGDGADMKSLTPSGDTHAEQLSALTADPPPCSPVKLRGQITLRGLQLVRTSEPPRKRGPTTAPDDRFPVPPRLSRKGQASRTIEKRLEVWGKREKEERIELGGGAQNKKMGEPFLSQGGAWWVPGRDSDALARNSIPCLRRASARYLIRPAKPRPRGSAVRQRSLVRWVWRSPRAVERILVRRWPRRTSLYAGNTPRYQSTLVPRGPSRLPLILSSVWKVALPLRLLAGDP